MSRVLRGYPLRPRKAVPRGRCTTWSLHPHPRRPLDVRRGWRRGTWKPLRERLGGKGMPRPLLAVVPCSVLLLPTRRVGDTVVLYIRCGGARSAERYAWSTFVVVVCSFFSRRVLFYGGVVNVFVFQECTRPAPPPPGELCTFADLHPRTVVCVSHSYKLCVSPCMCVSHLVCVRRFFMGARGDRNLSRMSE